MIPPNTYDTLVKADRNIGTIANRFCWTPKCHQIGETFPFRVNAFSLGCDGRSQDSILFQIEVTPPIVDFPNPENVIIPYGSEYCQDITFNDTSIVDLLKIQVNSTIFDEGAIYPDLSSSYIYNDSIITNRANNSSGTKILGTRFCWIPDCEHIGKTFNIDATLLSLDCPSGINQSVSFNYTVTPPFDSLDIIPNVFSPNGDGLNDTYKINGISNPCNDKIQVDIYSRWGKKVYESSDPTFEWNGTNKSGNDVPNGTYFVIIKGVFGSETIELEQRTITLLR